jgi:hypothetical protein
VQRLFESDQAKKENQNANETLIAKPPTQSEWLIDDEESADNYPMDYSHKPNTTV